MIGRKAGRIAQNGCTRPMRSYWRGQMRRAPLRLSDINVHEAMSASCLLLTTECRMLCLHVRADEWREITHRQDSAGVRESRGDDFTVVDSESRRSPHMQLEDMYMITPVLPIDDHLPYGDEIVWAS